MVTATTDTPDILKQRFIKAKKALFEKLYSDLNDSQREAVFSLKGPLLVLAGAGSGKTTVLTRRIAQIIRFGDSYNSEIIPSSLSEDGVALLEQALSWSNSEIENILEAYAVDPCPPWAVLSITFTNKAAAEMKERLTKAVGEFYYSDTDEKKSSADDIWAGTFHSICMRILRRYYAQAGLKAGFTIYDSDDSKRLITHILKDLNIDEKTLAPRAALNAISRLKDQLTTPIEFEFETGEDVNQKRISKVYTEYQKRLEEANVLDFDDIIMKTVLLLRSDTDAYDYYTHKFRYVCVDEYQDTNRAQLELILLLSGRFRNLMVVGDDDQSIYKFRGACIENILNFDRDLEGTKIVKLEQNYRSTKNILGAANSVIANNLGRHAKQLYTDREDGEKVVIKKLDNQNEEARYIINKIAEISIREKRKFSDFAVLYRMNAQSNSLETVFARSGIPYRILGGLRFYERKEIKDILAYLCVINNGGDNLRLRRIINEPKRKIGETTVNALEQIAAAEGISMLEVMEHADRYPAIAKFAPKLREFTQLVGGLREIAAAERLPVLIEKTIELTGYRRMLLSLGDNEIDRLENVQELISNAIQYENEADDPSLDGFLESVSLVADVDNYDANADAVVLMTVHSAKGLEFPVVFIPGFEEGIFPGMQATLYPDELEEERRLAYVAITRAKDRLFCSYVRERMLFGRTQFNHPSRFTKEIDEQYAENDILKKQEQRAEEAKESAVNGGRKRKPVMSKEFFKQADATANMNRGSGIVSFEAGDVVSHNTFGRGEILSAKLMGADILYEIAFDTAGTKKLMATFAKLKKFEE